jgi:hypothetical protein
LNTLRHMYPGVNVGLADTICDSVLVVHTVPCAGWRGVGGSEVGRRWGGVGVGVGVSEV